MISFQNITKTYPSRGDREEKKALDNLSFEIKDKGFVSIVGRSGAGKSTIFKLILAEERPTEGEIFFEGINVNEVRNGDLPKIRRRIGTVFQEYRLFPQKTVNENVAYIMEVMGAGKEEIERDIKQVLGIVGLTDKGLSFPRELSGGERQRVAIARALIHRPDVILADEPTGNLDPYHSFDIIKLLVRICELGTTVVLATHDKEIINYLGKRVITLDDGKLVRDEERGRFVL